MALTIKQLYKEIGTDTTLPLITTLKSNHISHLNEYLLFDLDDKMTDELLKNIEFLADDSLWTKEELADYHVIARTIDNDFILDNDSTVLIIPSHLNKSDSETFNLSIWQFLIQFEEKTLDTHILALN